MKRLILCDMDGVLANNAHREHLLPPKDDCNTTEKWDAFNNACDQDEPIEHGFRLLEQLIYANLSDCLWGLWSGRVSLVMEKSINWFEGHSDRLYNDVTIFGMNLRFAGGYFRSVDDHRRASDCKADLVKQAVADARLVEGDELILIDDDLSVLEECRKFFPNAICIWIGNSHCSAKANGVTTK